jgi:ADP-ribose pyrophosphatase YjhB (NUDIX family)
MISKNKPENFNPKWEVVSCFVEYKNEILLLLRQDHKLQPNTWGVPAGKVDIGETIRKAMKRE